MCMHVLQSGALGGEGGLGVEPGQSAYQRPFTQHRLSSMFWLARLAGKGMQRMQPFLQRAAWA